MRRFLPVLTLQLSDELPLLLVHVKVDAPVGYHLTRTDTYLALLQHRHPVKAPEILFLTHP